MVINLKQLYDVTGDSLPLDYSIGTERLAEIKGYTFANPIEVTGVVRNRAGIVSLNFTAKFTLTAECDRCLEKFDREYKFDNEHILVRSLNTDNDEYIVTNSDLFDLDELVITDVLLQLPTKMLCKDDCKGLCPICGTNLNNNVCDCNG